jgi:hypothetical protein
MKYYFAVDGRAAGPLRNSYQAALEDACNAGMAINIGRGQYKLDSNLGAEICADNEWFDTL